MPYHPDFKNSHGEGIDLHVLVFTRPNLRSDEYQVYMGKSIIENLFDKVQVDEKTKEIFLQYPERWCNILEQRKILHRITLLYPNIQKVTIVTHSVYIIQCTHHEQIGICDQDLQKEYFEMMDKDDTLETRYCPPFKENAGLQIFTA